MSGGQIAGVSVRGRQNSRLNLLEREEHILTMWRRMAEETLKVLQIVTPVSENLIVRGVVCEKGLDGTPRERESPSPPVLRPRISFSASLIGTIAGCCTETPISTLNQSRPGLLRWRLEACDGCYRVGFAAHFPVNHRFHGCRQVTSGVQK